MPAPASVGLCGMSDCVDMWLVTYYYKRDVINSGKAVIPRIALVLLVIASCIWAGERFLVDLLVDSLVHESSLELSDAIVIENFGAEFLLFQEAKRLHSEGWARRILVPVEADRTGRRAETMAEAIVEVMARGVGLLNVERIPVRQVEPITFQTAVQVRDFLVARRITSVIIVSSGFRSERSYLVWSSVLQESGIRVSLVSVFGSRNRTNWRRTWHGWQEVILQFVKLVYYRVAVL